MSTPANPSTPPDRADAETRPMYWSVRREVWENRSIYLAPLAVASVFLFGFLIRTMVLPHRVGRMAALEPARQQQLILNPFSIGASVILLTGFVVGMFYCLDALHGERRDRSILFWKSMPVSDRTTVLSKASIPLVVLPLLTVAIVLVVQAVMFVASTVIFAAYGLRPATVWAHLPLFRMLLVMLYGVAVHALWYAPIHGWLLLLSAWARRAVILWAILPAVLVGIFERMVFGTTYVPGLVKYRFLGAMTEAFAANAGRAPITRLSQLAPAKFLSAPGLWLGLLFAAACVAAAIRLRRNREPI
jgi:ABC-2 type transport system permease protein